MSSDRQTMLTHSNQSAVKHFHNKLALPDPWIVRWETVLIKATHAKAKISQSSR